MYNLIELLEEWVEINGEPCRLDHHGYCQSHYLQEGDDCIVKRSKEAIQREKEIVYAMTF